MPYITQLARERIEGEGNLMALSSAIGTSGELNYAITELLIEYVRQRKLNYEMIATISGVLSDVKAEFYRRVAVPYEEKKIRENGDVFPVEIAPVTLRNGDTYRPRIEPIVHGGGSYEVPSQEIGAAMKRRPVVGDEVI